MKTQLTSRDIRCQVVKSPDKTEIEQKVKQANNITRTALTLMVFPEIYTR